MMNASLTPELEKLEAQLHQSNESLDTCKGACGEEVIRRFRKRIKEVHALRA